MGIGPRPSAATRMTCRFRLTSRNGSDAARRRASWREEGSRSLVRPSFRARMVVISSGPSGTPSQTSCPRVTISCQRSDSVTSRWIDKVLMPRWPRCLRDDSEVTSVKVVYETHRSSSPTTRMLNGDRLGDRPRERAAERLGEPRCEPAWTEGPGSCSSRAPS